MPSTCKTTNKILQQHNRSVVIIHEFLITKWILKHTSLNG
uniref:Uncharacterized protein n=1 Tax=Populus trichocarpa TaxID=3694 RepID=A0A3N7E7Y6_POPTR